MPGLDTLIPPPIVALATGLGIWQAAQRLPQVSLRTLLSPQLAADILPYTPYIAGGIAAVGVGIQLSAVLGFRAKKTTITPLKPSEASSLVTDGIFAYSRNPMYLSMATLLTAWSVYLQSPVVGAVSLAAFVTYINYFQIRPEEEALREIFPAEYTAYVKSVRRWI